MRHFQISSVRFPTRVFVRRGCENPDSYIGLCSSTRNKRRKRLILTLSVSLALGIDLIWPSLFRSGES